MTTTFRVTSALAAGVIGVLLLAGCGSPQAGAGTSVPIGTTVAGTVPATGTAVPPTAVPPTGVPPTDQPTLVPPTVGTGSDATPPPTDGPRPGATPLLWLTSGPGLYCDTRGTLVPQLVVYSDFSVLQVEDGIGAHCESVPTVSTGWIQRRVVAAAISRFHDQGLAGVDLRLTNVMDAGTAFISLAEGDVTQVASVYALGLDVDVPADQVAARAAVQQIYDDLTAGFQRTGDWTPDQLTVNPSSTVTEGTAVPAWPSVKPGSDCQVVPEADVPAVLRANGDRTAGASWKVGGRTVDLALGLVLPGFVACAPVVGG